MRRNKETGEQGGEEAAEKEVSARRRRRSGRRKHKELVVGMTLQTIRHKNKIYMTLGLFA